MTYNFEPLKTEEPCPKCGTREVYYETRQVRAGDEGETIFYECPNCGHKWRG